METEAVLAWLDNVVPTQTGEQLSELERVILKQVWLGRKYLEIADTYGCTEGHAKDVGSGLWKLLSKVTRQKITKSNCRRVLEKCVRKASVMSGFLDCSSDYSKLDYPKTSDSFSDRFSDYSSDRRCSQANLSFERATHTTEMITQTQDNNFIGRSTALSHIYHLKNQASKLVVIQGEGGNGKTTLSQRYLYTQHFYHHQLQPNQFDIVLELLIAKEIQNITPAQRQGCFIP